MSPFRHQRGGGIRLHPAGVSAMNIHAVILSTLVASIMVLELGPAPSASGQSHQPVPDDATCEAADFPDARYASALDAYEVRWDAFRAMAGVPVAQAEPWLRVFDLTHDGADSLRSARQLKANEEVQLIAHVRGPARVSFWWRAQPGTGDFVRFRYKKADADEHAPTFATSLTELIWIYAEDGNTQEDNVGPDGDGLWIDQVEIDAEHYRSIPYEVRHSVATTVGPAQPSNYIELTWPTLHGRIYRLEYKEGENKWNQAQEPERGDGTPMSVRELAENYELRKDQYRVRMLDPPTLTSAPKEHHVRLAEGTPFRLDYSAEGATEVTDRLKWIWRRWPLNGDRPVTVPNDRPTLEIVSVRPEDSAEYEVQVHNAWGCEVAPPVRLEVFRKPSIEKLRWWIGDGEPVEETLSSGAASEDMLSESEPLRLEVRSGDSFRIEADIGGTAPIDVQWERRARGTNWWTPLERSGRDVTVDAADADLDGAYRVVARSDWGEDIGPPVIVDLLEEPTVVWLLEGQEILVFAGDIVTLSVRPAGTPPFDYTWYVDKRAVAARGASYRPNTNLAESHSVRTTIEAHVSNATGVTTSTHEIRLLIKPLDPREISDLDLKLLPVPAGKFRMGAPSALERRHDEGPMRSVTLTHSYWMAETELTEHQWNMVMGTPMAPGSDTELLPASLTFEEAEAFVAALTERERASGNIGLGMRFAIPTEAQWERVAKREASDPAEVKHLVAPDSPRPLPVKSGPASMNGFYELFGNAWEWTADWYVSKHDVNATLNPTGPVDGDRRVLRGGSVSTKPDRLSPTIRYNAEVDERSKSRAYGLRILLKRIGSPIEYVIGEIPRQGHSPEEPRSSRESAK